MLHAILGYVQFYYKHLVLVRYEHNIVTINHIRLIEHPLQLFLHYPLLPERL